MLYDVQVFMAPSLFSLIRPAKLIKNSMHPQQICHGQLQLLLRRRHL